jgi:hypothetical protein
VALIVACSNSSTTKYDGGFGAGGSGTRHDGGLGGKGGAGGTSGGGGTLGSGGILGGGGTLGLGGIFGGGGTTARGGAGGTGVGAGGSGGIDGGAIDGGVVDANQRDGETDVPLATDAPADGGDAGPAPVCGPFANADGGMPANLDGGTTSPLMSFFVSSFTSVTGNLGGLAGADQRCQNLAAAVGLPSPLWHAYLSAEHDPPVTGPSVNARDRIGAGPWYNARGELLAMNLTALHARTGDAAVFLDEHGDMINGQWTGSPAPVEHDILTGSNPDGTVALGKTCADWTSDQGPPDGGVPDGGGAAFVARVGHSDGLGPMCSTATTPINYTSWSSSHDNAGCNNTLPLGGAGRIYCFKANP